MALDLLPRLVVHTYAGDFTIDPWSSGRFDLTPYGITDYSIRNDPGGQFTVTLQHALYGPIVLQPFAPGAPTDLSMYGITRYEIVFGMPVTSAPLIENLTAWLALGGVALVGWWWWRR